MLQQEVPISRPSADGGSAVPAAGVDPYRGKMWVLWLSFFGFSISFAAWLMFGVLQIPIREEFGLDSIQLGWLGYVALVNGSIWRVLFGMLADRWGGRVVFVFMMLFASFSAFFVSWAESYVDLMICAFLVGFAGNTFSVGSTWNAAWFPKQQQGFAMGLFGAGNVGASVTKIIGPTLIALIPAGFWWSVTILPGKYEFLRLPIEIKIPGGWRFVPYLYGWMLLIMAGLMWFLAPTPDRRPAAGRTFWSMCAPLKEMRVWRFSLYYIVVFGAYVALSFSLPRYFYDHYHTDLKSWLPSSALELPAAAQNKILLSYAAYLTIPFIFASSLLRPLGGWLADTFGPRKVTYVVFIAGIVICGILSIHVNIYFFSVLVLLLGVTQGIGKASTIKYIPEYYPKDVGIVVGLVGALAALGGAFMPPIFDYLNKWTGLPESMFWVVLAITIVSLLWLHVVVMKIHRQEAKEI